MEVNQSNSLKVLCLSGALVSLLIIVALSLFFVPSPTPLEPPTAATSRAIAPPVQPFFIDETFVRGINHSHLERSKNINGLHELFGAGICPIDVNNDGWIDLFFVAGSGAHKFYGKKSWWAGDNGNQLYLNKGNGYFDNISEQAGVNNSYAGMGCATADLDNDGDDDLVVSTLGPNYLYENLGNHQFKQTVLSGTDEWSTTIALGDVNNDGLLDIYIANFLNYSHHENKYEPSSGHHITSMANFNAKMYQPQPNFLYINQGNMRFDESAATFGVDNTDGRSVFATWHDINHDGFTDLFVGNREGSFSKLYLNQLGTHFIEASDHQRFPFPKNYHALTLGDLLGDADLELVFSGAAGQPLGIYKLESGAYQDISAEFIQPSNSPYGREKFGAIVLDTNLDGTLDIVSANGYMLPDLDSPSLPLGQTNLWLTNNGQTLTASESGRSFNLSQTSYSSRGIVSVDIDNDGDNDIIISNNNHYPQLLINKADSNNLTTDDSAGAIVTGFLSSYRHRDQRDVVSEKITLPPLSFLAFKALMLTRPDQMAFEQLRHSYETWQAEEKILSLKLLSRGNSAELLHALIQLTLTDDARIALTAIHIAALKDYEAFLYDILLLTSHRDDHVACTALKTIEDIFLREESFVRQRGALATTLTSLLSEYNQDVTICAIQALAKSRTKRPIEKLSHLALDNNIEIAAASIQALGELKHNQAVTTLTTLANGTNKHLAMEATMAMARLSGEVEIQRSAPPPASPFEQHSEPAQKKRLSCHLDKAFNGVKYSGLQLSTLLRLCAVQDLTSWTEKNTTLVAENHATWLHSWQIDPETYALFMTQLLDEMPHSGPQLAVGALALNPPPGISEVIVHSLFRGNGSSSSTVTSTDFLIKIATNKSLSANTRLSASEILLLKKEGRAVGLIEQISTELTHDRS